MKLKKHVMENAFCMPRGVLGRVGGQLLSLDRGLHAWVLDLLAICASDSVLDVGSGPGIGVELAASRAHNGWVAGVDPSDTMLEMANRRNCKQIEAGRVTFRYGIVDQLPFDDETFDAAMAVNTLHIWPDPVRGLVEIRRTLRPGGRIAVAVTRYSYASTDGVERHLIDGGFRDVKSYASERGTAVLGRS